MYVLFAVSDVDVRVHCAGLKRRTCFISAQCSLFHLSIQGHALGFEGLGLLELREASTLHMHKINTWINHFL